METSLFCHPCLTDAYDPGEEPAVTMFEGTPMCANCARTDARNREISR